MTLQYNLIPNTMHMQSSKNRNNIDKQHITGSLLHHKTGKEQSEN
jgi:hypothetical protein